MAISDETAALVAAQLTLANTIRMGAAVHNSRFTPADREAEILSIYLRFKDACRETTLKGGD